MRIFQSIPPLVPPPLCFPESRVIPDLSKSQTPDVVVFDDESALQRFAEEVDAGLCWDPNSVSQQRIVEAESLPLEQRGLTRQFPLVSKKKTPKLSQSEFWKLQTSHKFTVASKLREEGMTKEASILEACHSYYTVATCGDCGSVRKFPNRCDLFFCPECASHLQNERTKQVEWWALRIKQPKHVVLTVRNIPDLSPGHVDELRRMFTRLRKRKFARNWLGGYYGIQVTNEGKGWHLHIHALIDARWIDQDELKKQWLAVSRGAGYIVKVKDCRSTDYLRETTRYVIHGSQLATWEPFDIATFVRSFTGKRTFGVFGNLYGARTEFAEWIATLKQAKPRCQCGSCNVTYQSEESWEVSQLGHQSTTRPRPPPVRERQISLISIPVQWPD